MSEDLRRALEVHRNNLYQLELQAAQYGAGLAPTSIVNAIRAEKEEIEKIEARLDQLESSTNEGKRARRAKPSTSSAPTMQEFHALLEPLREKIQALEIALTRLETDQRVRLLHLEEEIKSLRQTVRDQHHVEPIPRVVLVSGGVVSFLILALLIFLSVRLW